MTETEIKAALYDLIAKRQQIAAQVANLNAADRGLVDEMIRLETRLAIIKESETAQAVERPGDVTQT